MESVKNLSPQSCVYIELIGDDCYTGTLKVYNQKFKFVELIDVTDTISAQKLDGAQTFYESEIKTIQALDRTPPDSVESTESLTESKRKKSSHNEITSLQSERKKSSAVDTKSMNSTSGEFKLAKEHSLRNGFHVSMESIATSISEKELEEIKERIRSVIYISQCDGSYHEALDDLRRQEIVGLNIEGADLGRLKTGTLLSFSTNEKIYLFDMIMLGKMFPEIKRILEAEKPRKVVHNSCLIVDQLKHNYNCQLKSIHDTLVSFTYLLDHFNTTFQFMVVSSCFTDHSFLYP